MKRISEDNLDKTFSEEWIITPAKYEQLKDCRCEELEEEIADLKARLEQVERSKGGGGSNAGADANEKPGGGRGDVEAAKYAIKIVPVKSCIGSEE